MGCDQSNQRKAPATEEEKKNMTEPWAVDKCPKQYCLPHLGSSSKSARITTTVHVASPRTSLSATAHIRAPNSLRSSSQPAKRIITSASAGEVPTFRIAMELTRSSIFEEMIARYPINHYHNSCGRQVAEGLFGWEMEK